MNLITIVLPIFNVEEYLEECLNSLENQTNTNFSVIAVNDGSTDDSLEILINFKKKSNIDIKLINQENKGLSDARNAAIEYIETKYTYFMDSDDFLDKNCINDVIKVIEKSEVDLVKFDAEPFTDQLDIKINKYEYNSKKYLEANTVLNKEKFLTSQMNFFNAPVWLYIFKTEILNKNNISFKSKLIHEDELFTPILFSSCETFYYLPIMYFKRRYRKNSIMTTKRNGNKKNKSTNDEKILSGLYEYKKELSDEKTIEQAFLENRINSFYYIMNRKSIYYLKNSLYYKRTYNVKLKRLQKIKILINYVLGK